MGLTIRGEGHLQMELSPAGLWATATGIICCLQLGLCQPLEASETMWLVRKESELDLVEASC